jgi:signal transduction histidine kinase
MELPALLLDDNLRPALEFVSHVKGSLSQCIILDATQVLTIEPVAACLLAVAAKSAAQAGKVIQIHGLDPRLRPIIDGFDSEIEFSNSDVRNELAIGELRPSVSRCVASASSANAVSNTMASHIARFIPTEDREEMLRNEYGARIHHAIQPALAYALVELVDNVFSHAATDEIPAPNAWMVVQSYPSGDLVRIAVVDDGCGLLASLRGSVVDPPKSHREAAERAFVPFLSSKNAPSIYAERKHMGLGLSVCRAICQRLDGRIYAASGNAWVESPGLATQSNKTVPFFQGTIIALEMHRRAVTVGLLQQILAAFSGSPDLRLRFN